MGTEERTPCREKERPATMAPAIAPIEKSRMVIQVGSAMAWSRTMPAITPTVMGSRGVGDRGALERPFVSWNSSWFIRR